MRQIICIIILAILPYSAFARHKKPEKAYQKEWCDANGGITEYKLNDGTRVDCLTSEYAIEFDFAQKMYEAGFQSLHYARLTGKKAGIVLILESQEDFKYYTRLMAIITHYQMPIEVWIVKNF